jgi:membrane fusion protein (multidrug efflux system)
MEETGPVRNNGNNKGRRRLMFGGFVAAVLFAIFLIVYLQYRSSHVTTDDAYVEGKVHTIASKVAGTVKHVLAADNQSVKKGDILVEIDEVDYDIKVKEAVTSLDTERRKLSEAESRLDVARRQMDEIRAAIGSAKATVELQQANARQAGLDMKRAENLYKSEAISKERYERATTSLEVAEAQLKAAREQVKRLEASLAAQMSNTRQAEASVRTQEAAIKQHQTLVEAANLSRSYVRISSPVDGYVTKKSVEVGNQISPGQPLLAVVPLSDTWVVANYKETQVEKIKAGQKVNIKVDALPGRKFRGIVESIMAGTGTTFSLFPPENATGNYVKVVQRIPVKIVLEKDDDDGQSLRIGMSVVPTVIVK